MKDPVAALRDLKQSFGLDPKKPWPRLEQIGRDPANWPELLGISRVQALRLQVFLVPPADVDLPEAKLAAHIDATYEKLKKEGGSRKSQVCRLCGDTGHNARSCSNKQPTPVREPAEDIAPYDNRDFWRPVATILVEYIRALMPEGATVLQCLQQGKACSLTNKVTRNALAWAHQEGLLVFNYERCVWRTAK